MGNVHRAFLYNSVPKNTSMKPSLLENPNNNITTTKKSNFKLVCYYNFPNSPTTLHPDQIDPYLCSHINAAFAGVVNNSLSMDLNSIEVLKNLVKLKMVNSKLKILVCVGGAGNDEGWTEMVMNHTNRKR